jgi:hypothetical protein
MAKTDRREIVGDVRYALATDLRQQYPGVDGAHGFSHTDVAHLIKSLLGMSWTERAADYYIAPGDGGGLIMVEVGERDEAKWASLASTDGQPVRVLNVGFDRTVTLEHARHTQFEDDMLSVLARRL